jgi:hypothetical protein
MKPRFAGRSIEAGDEPAKQAASMKPRFAGRSIEAGDEPAKRAAE